MHSIKRCFCVIICSFFLVSCARMLQGNSVFKLINDHNLNELSINDESSLNKGLFNSFCEEICGTWYGKKYLKSIKNKDNFGGHIFTCSFGYDELKKTYYWALWNGWDGVSGDITNISKVSGTNNFKLKVDEGYSDFTFYVVDNQIEKMILGDLDENDSGFYKIPYSIEDYINDNVLVGEYRDSKGLIYKFTKEKKAIWPDRTFQYTPYDSITGWECNPIIVIDDNGKSTQEYYGYLFIDNKLNLYKVTPDESFGYIPEEQPFAILERIR